MHPVPRLVSVHGVCGEKHSALCVLQLQTEYVLTAVLAVRRVKKQKRNSLQTSGMHQQKQEYAWNVSAGRNVASVPIEVHTINSGNNSGSKVTTNAYVSTVCLKYAQVLAKSRKQNMNIIRISGPLLRAQPFVTIVTAKDVGNATS